LSTHVSGNGLDRKGILTFLVITFVVSYALQWIVMRIGSLTVLAYLVPFVPAFAAAVASRVSVTPAYPRGTLWPMPKLTVLRMACVIPLLFAAAYCLPWALGLLTPDWTLSELISMLPFAERYQLPAALAGRMPLICLAGGIALSVVLGPTAYALLLAGNEYGWRGYLLPRLMPLGRWPAYGIVGVMWGFSFMPLMLNNSSGSAIRNGLLALAMAMILSAALGEVWRRSRHLGLTIICAGCLVCQASSVWVYVFPGATTAFPWSDRFGLIALVVWAIVAAVPNLLFGKLERTHAA
jgi:hypothetical protein